jgi:hypothetical protein
MHHLTQCCLLLFEDSWIGDDEQAKHVIEALKVNSTVRQLDLRCYVNAQV